MATITRFEDLEIWKLAREQADEIHKMIKAEPLSRDFPLRDQMNASSGSVMDCIAEGFERSGTPEFKNFLVISKGSNGELRSQLYRCFDRKYISEENLNKNLERNILLGKKLMTFIQYLQKTSIKGERYKRK